MEMEIGYSKFIAMSCTFFRIDGQKSHITMNFDYDLDELSDWYDIKDHESLVFFLFYVAQDPIKQNLLFYVIAKVVGVPSKRSSNEYVMGNNVNKVGVKFVNYIDDDQANGVDSTYEQIEDQDNEENNDLEWCDGDFSRYCEEGEEWPDSTKFPFVPLAEAEPSQVKAKNFPEGAGNHSLKIILHIF